MLQIFWSANPATVNGDGLLDHPALLLMTPDQLSDLPLTPEWPHAVSETASARIESGLGLKAGGMDSCDEHRNDGIKGTC